jgi:hypothetical protein
MSGRITPVLRLSLTSRVGAPPKNSHAAMWLAAHDA